MPKKIYYSLKLTLMDLPFEVTRSLIVPADIRLDYLHEVFQYTMGWRNSHFHEFQTKNKRYGMKSPDSDDLCDERKVRLTGIVKPNYPYFGYVYDYGDEWVHQIHVTDFDCKYMPSKRSIFCTEAKGACPPEDVGGAPGYEEFCQVINDPGNPENEEMAEWVYETCRYPRSQKWPHGVSLDSINMVLQNYERYYRRQTAPKKPKPPRMWVFTGKK